MAYCSSVVSLRVCHLCLTIEKVVLCVKNIVRGAVGR